VQRWPETKRLLGLLVNSSGRAHGRNARRLVHAARKQDRRLAVALLAAAVSHTPEGEEVLRGARMRMARKPSGVARELLRNFPKGGKRRRKRGKRGQDENGGAPENGGGEASADKERDGAEKPRAKRARQRKRRKGASRPKAGSADGDSSDARSGDGEVDLAGADRDPVSGGGDDDQVATAVDPVGDA
jgi:ribonuclease E